jgi:hypothetical protein
MRKGSVLKPRKPKPDLPDRGATISRWEPREVFSDGDTQILSRLRGSEEGVRLEARGHHFPFHKKRVIRLGRNFDNDIVVRRDELVSRYHARILRTEHGYSVEDLGSTNGTALNGNPIPAKKPHPLADGDRIQISPKLSFFFKSESPSANGLDGLLR